MSHDKNSPDELAQAAELGRAVAAEFLGHELAEEHLTPAQRERAQKRRADLDGTDTADPSPEARTGDLSEPERLGHDLARQHMTPAQQERAAAVAARRAAETE
jgi:hypothetical protein